MGAANIMNTEIIAKECEGLYQRYIRKRFRTGGDQREMAATQLTADLLVWPQQVRKSVDEHFDGCGVRIPTNRRGNNRERCAYYFLCESKKYILLGIVAGIGKRRNRIRQQIHNFTVITVH